MDNPSSITKIIKFPISTENDHYGIIDQGGNLWMTGKGDWGQLGDGTEEDRFYPVKVLFPSKVISVSCCYLSTGVVTEDGKTYYLGRDPKPGPFYHKNQHELGPVLLEKLKDKFAVKIVTHSTKGYGVILKDGSAFINIAHPTNDKLVIDQFISLDFPIVDLKIGDQIVFFLTSNGEIYMIGKQFLPETNKHISSEIKDTFIVGIENNRLDPVIVPFSQRVKQIEIGNDLIVLTTQGEVYRMNSYGDNGELIARYLNSINPEGQSKSDLDLETAIKGSLPRKIELPEKVSFISAYHQAPNIEVIGVVTETGELYMWGNNLNENIALFNELNRPKSYLLTEPVQLRFGSKISYISSTNKYNIAVTQDGEVNFWGKLDLAPTAPVKSNWFSNCSNSTSMISLEDWEQDTNYVKIYGLDSAGKILEKPNCYNRQNLIRFAESNVFANWEPRRSQTEPGKVQNIDISGMGGKPGTLRYYRLIGGEFIDHYSYERLINRSIREFVMKPNLLNMRIGNLQGTFGIGQHHGQSPGFTIYSLKPRT